MVITTARTNPETHKRVGQLIICGGGSARQMIAPFLALCEEQHATFAKHLCVIDTDPKGDVDANGSFIFIGLSPQQLHVIKSDAKPWGFVAETMCSEHARYMRWQNIKSGSRTFRGLSQLAMIFHRERIESMIAQAIRDLVRNGVTEIQPLLVSSTGGGAGSAISIWLSLLFSDPNFYAAVTEGLPPYSVAPPLLHAVEPYAYAMKAKLKQKTRILSNAMAFRIEAAELQKRDVISYVFLTGLSNSHAVLDSEKEIANNLAAGTFMLCTSWDYLTSRWVDSVDSDRMTSGWLLHNTPEVLWPDDTPSTGTPPNPRDDSDDDDCFPIFSGDDDE